MAPVHTIVSLALVVLLGELSHAAPIGNNATTDSTIATTHPSTGRDSFSSVHATAIVIATVIAASYCVVLACSALCERVRFMYIH